MAGAQPPFYTSLCATDGGNTNGDAAPPTSGTGRARSRAAKKRTLACASAGLLAVLGAAAVVLLAPQQAGLAAGLDKDEVIVAAEKEKEEEEKRECSPVGVSCNETECCKDAGYQCYEKVPGSGGWSMCRLSCVPGPSPVDPDPTPWTCKELGSRTPGRARQSSWVPTKAPWVQRKCSNSTADCSDTRCCTQPGTACFRKSGAWSGCKPDCVAGPDPTDDNPEPWNCTQLGERTPGIKPLLPVAPWVKANCSGSDENCIDTRCCRDAGHQCFEKNEHFGMCEPVCTRGMSLTDDKDWKPWSCKALGGRTPGGSTAPQPPKLADWVDDHCSDYGDDCRSSRCCKHEASQCYSRDKDYASCLYGCVPGHRNFSKHVFCQKHHLNSSDPLCRYDGATWSCDKLGPRTPRPWGTPTLYCMHVMRVHTYEADIIRGQLAMDGRFRGGIFSCDQYALYASDAPGGTHMGDGPLGPVRTKHFKSAPVWTSKDGTAANTALFMNVWEAVRWDGTYRCCQWTIKADPDAVVLPDRLRSSLKKYSGRQTYIVTCNKGFADGPMMFGAMEAISSGALTRYFQSESTCRNMPWQSWGEDLWMGKCLQGLGIPAVEDHGIVADNLCYGANCGNGYSAAFHPFKSKDAWMACYWQTTR